MQHHVRDYLRRFASPDPDARVRDLRAERDELGEAIEDALLMLGTGACAEPGCEGCVEDARQARERLLETGLRPSGYHTWSEERQRAWQGLLSSRL